MNFSKFFKRFRPKPGHNIGGAWYVNSWADVPPPPTDESPVGDSPEAAPYNPNALDVVGMAWSSKYLHDAKSEAKTLRQDLETASKLVELFKAPQLVLKGRALYAFNEMATRSTPRWMRMAEFIFPPYMPSSEREYKAEQLCYAIVGRSSSDHFSDYAPKSLDAFLKLADKYIEKTGQSISKLEGISNEIPNT